MERSIAHIKGRFRKLQSLDSVHMEHACKIVTATCILHNMCVLSDDDISMFIEQEQDHDNHPNNYPNIFRNALAGNHKHNIIVQNM